MKTKKNILPNLLSFILNIILGAGISIASFYSLLDYNLIAHHPESWPNPNNELMQIIIITILIITAIIVIGALLNYLLYKLYKKLNAEFSKMAVSISLLAFMLGVVISRIIIELPYVITI